MSKWDVWFLLLLLFFSLLLPDVEAPTSCVLEAGVREEVRGGELEPWMEDGKPEALLWGACSSAFLLTPVRWPPATDPIMAHSFVWSTETTTEEEEAEAEDEDDEVGSRTSMSSWAANFSSKLWMQLWLTGVSVCWRQFNHAKINKTDYSFFSVPENHCCAHVSHCWVRLWWRENPLGVTDSDQRDMPTVSSPILGLGAFLSLPETGQLQMEQDCHSSLWNLL